MTRHEIEQGNRYRARALATHPDRYANPEIVADDMGDVLTEARRAGVLGDEHAALITSGLQPIIDAIRADGVRQFLAQHAALFTTPDHAGHPVVVAVADDISIDELGGFDSDTARLVTRAMRAAHAEIVQHLTDRAPTASGDAADPAPPFECSGCSSPLCPDCRPPRTAFLQQPVVGTVLPAGPDYPGPGPSVEVSARGTVVHGTARAARFPVPDPVPPRPSTKLLLLTRAEWLAESYSTGRCATCSADIEVEQIDASSGGFARAVDGRWSCPNGCQPPAP